MATKTAKPRKPKLSLPNLVLLEWLCERPRHRLFTNHNINPRYPSNVTYLYEMGEPNDSGKRPISRPYPSSQGGMESDAADLAYETRFGGKVGKDCDKLTRAGYVRCITSLFEGREEYERFVATLDHSRNPFHYSERIHFLTDEGIAYWENEGRADLEGLRSKIAEQRAGVDRLILIGARTRISPTLPKRIHDAVRCGIRLPHLERVLVRPYALARVVKETESRFYVENVEILRKDGDTVPGSSVYGIIEGRPPNLYVSKDHVMRDHISRKMAARAVDLHEEYAQDTNRIMLETIERILPVLAESASRLDQMSAAHDDMMKELLAPDR